MKDNVRSLLKAAQERNPADEFLNMKRPTFRLGMESLRTVQKEYASAKRGPLINIAVWSAYALLIIGIHFFQAAKGASSVDTDVIGAVLLVICFPLAHRFLKQNVIRWRQRLRSSLLVNLGLRCDLFVARVRHLASAIAIKAYDDDEKLLMAQAGLAAEALGESLADLEAEAAAAPTS